MAWSFPMCCLWKNGLGWVSHLSLGCLTCHPGYTGPGFIMENTWKQLLDTKGLSGLHGLVNSISAGTLGRVNHQHSWSQVGLQMMLRSSKKYMTLPYGNYKGYTPFICSWLFSSCFIWNHWECPSPCKINDPHRSYHPWWICFENQDW